MSPTNMIALATLIVAAAFFVWRAVPALRDYFTYCGKRIITCPETHRAEAVEVDATETALGTFLTEPTFRLRECSRWPERQNCGQDCLLQVAADPASCLVWNMVSHWYEGKVCVFCRKPIASLHHLDHVPALLAPDRTTCEWKRVRPQQLPEVFETHLPVCWNCHVTETFRRLHPELVVNREPESRRILS